MKLEIFRIKLGLNSCYLIRGKDVVMVDGGMPDKLKLFKSELLKLEIQPSEIKLIVLTHSHFDHCGSAREIRNLTGAKVAIHESEKTYLENGGMLIPKGVNIYGKITQPLLFPFFKKISFPKFIPDILITDKPYSLSMYGIDGNIIYTPGHTKGSISVILDSGEGFVGCMAHNGLPFRIHPGLPIYAQDIESVKKCWKILIDKGVKMIYPGHGKPFPAEVMKKSLGY
ncbi:MAG: MBL fold metallo-hydrolase [Bacteroidales bacterium]|jgi:glyoxylase-like metal-dependent hydrolase (beta-lactamase superfamily II)